MDLFRLVLLLSLPLLTLIYVHKVIKSRSGPPGPRGLPFIGNLHQIDNSSLHTTLWNLSKSYGPIVSLRFGFIPAIVVSSASAAKEVLKTQDLIFCGRPSSISQLKLSYNGQDVAFSPYNDYWKEMRKLFSIHLLSPKMVKSSRNIREDEVARAMKKIHGLILSSKHVNLSEIAKSVSSTIIMRVGFGKRYEDGQEGRKIFYFLDELQTMITSLFPSDLWPSFPFVGLIDRLTANINRLEKCFKDLDSFYQEVIDEHLDPQNSKSNEEDRDIIDILLQLKKDQASSPIQITFDSIKAMITDVLVAGTDNSATTLVWAMTLLMKNPQVMKKAQEEVRNQVGDKGEINEDDLPKFTYLKAILKESMRLYPAAPLLVPRETTKDTILQGYVIKEKTLVHVNVLAIGRDPELWENPEEFSPERFLGSNIDFRGNDFELLPFGGGRRICPGILMGVSVVELFLANLLYKFEWGLPVGMTIKDIDCEAKLGLTMYKKNDLCLLPKVYM